MLSRRTLTLGLVATAISSCVRKDIDSYVIAGESDMSGRGLLNEYARPITPFEIFTSKYRWVDGGLNVDGIGDLQGSPSYDEISGLGPGVSFAGAVAKSSGGKPIGLIPCAKGGSTINDWQPSQSDKTLYGSMVSRAKAGGKVKAILWMQGKNDVNDPDAALGWGSKFREIVSSARKDIGISALPIVMAAIGNPVGVKQTHWQAIRDQQLAFEMDGVTVIDTFDLEAKQGDPIHLGTAAQIILGARFADAVQRFV